MDNKTTPTEDDMQKRESLKFVKKPNKVIPITSLLVGVLLAGVIGYCIGRWGFNRPGDNKIVTDSKAVGSSTVNNNKTYHTALSVGYPFNTTNKKLTIQLAAPNALQVISIKSTIQNPGYTDILANKFNEEMGRWQFGNPGLERDQIGDISLIHIGSDWLNEASQVSEPYYSVGSPLEGYDFTTPSKKASSLTKLEADTVACGKDHALGFVISTTINVCYKPNLIRQSVGSYSPDLFLKGYGVIGGERYVLVGYMALDDGTEYSEQEADKKGDAFLAGDIPQETKKIIDEYVNAIKNTTVVESER